MDVLLVKLLRNRAREDRNIADAEVFVSIELNVILGDSWRELRREVVLDFVFRRILRHFEHGSLLIGLGSVWLLGWVRLILRIQHWAECLMSVYFRRHAHLVLAELVGLHLKFGRLQLLVLQDWRQVLIEHLVVVPACL